MKFWIKDIDWDRICYTQAKDEDWIVDDYSMWVPKVYAVSQARANGRIRLIDRHGETLVSIDCNAFSSMEIINDYE